MTFSLDLEALREHFSHPRYRPQTFRELCETLSLRGGERKQLKQLLLRLQRRGEVVRMPNRRYAAPTRGRRVTGRFQSNAAGFGFIVPKDGSEDFYVPIDAVGNAVHGDIVTAEVVPGRGRGRSSARIREITERSLHTVVGEVRRDERRRLYLKPFGRNLNYTIQLDEPSTGAFDVTQRLVAVARMDWEHSRPGAFHGQITSVLGSFEDQKIDSLIVIHRAELPQEFPAAVLAEAEKTPDSVTDAEVQGRQDLRNIPFVTIDGADARDHDDAIALEGDDVIYVAIADVGHYVQPQGELDTEAASRANSYYFPDTVLPMLPPRLSNRICSLRPDEDRLVLSIRIRVTASGDLEPIELCEGVIRSRARLTYEGVDEELREQRALPMLRAMLKIADRLYERRMQEGGIDFELSESRVVLDEAGHVVAMARRERTPSQRIVEECMLAANRAVAKLLGDAGYPLVYRVHDRPAEKKLLDFLGVLSANGYTVPGDARKGDPRLIDQLLSRLRGEPRGRVFSQLALRAMAQAFYSTENIGHYGLGFEHYAHFTSPIRRYADLVVHRAARAFIRKERIRDDRLYPKAYGGLENLSTYISERERVAQTAEREVRTIKSIRFLEPRVGKSFRGFVSGIVGQGFFVELEEHSVEGFIHVRKLRRDRYDFVEREMAMRGRRHGKTIRLGDALVVKVDEVSLEDFRIEFSSVTPVL